MLALCGYYYSELPVYVLPVTGGLFVVKRLEIYVQNIFIAIRENRSC
jgi:hypothetical protein